MTWEHRGLTLEVWEPTGSEGEAGIAVDSPELFAGAEEGDGTPRAPRCTPPRFLGHRRRARRGLSNALGYGSRRAPPWRESGIYDGGRG